MIYSIMLTKFIDLSNLLRDLGVYHSITWYEWMMHGPILLLHCTKFLSRCFLLFKNLIIFFSEKTKSIKYEGIKSIIEGENSAGGN